MNERDEWEKTEDYTSVPLLLMSCGEKQPETEFPDQCQVPVKRVKTTCVKTRASKRRFVCNNKFEAIAEQDQDKTTRHDKRRVRFDCDSDASTSCGPECAERYEMDPNLVGSC